MSFEFHVDSLAYRKLILHAANFPASHIIGALIAKEEKVGDRTKIRFIDVMPLFHSPLTSPIVEISMKFAESFAAELGGFIGGLYSAHELFDRKEILPATLKLADKIAEQEKKFPASLLVIDNQKLDHLSGSACIESLHFINQKWIAPTEAISFTVDNEAIAEIPALLFDLPNWPITDFELHLEQVSKDWRNPQIKK